MAEFYFKSFPNLTTERLKLRQLEPDDAEKIYFLRSDDQVNKYLDRPRAITIDDAVNFILTINTGIDKNEYLYWGIVLQPENKLIGTICLWNFNIEKSVAEIGYELHPDFHGKGIMHEALTKVVEFGFQKMKLRAFEAYTNIDNVKSTLLLQRNHFKKGDFPASNEAGREGTSSQLIFTLTNPDQ